MLGFYMRMHNAYTVCACRRVLGLCTAEAELQLSVIYGRHTAVQNVLYFLHSYSKYMAQIISRNTKNI